jgi:hypothetical protein
VTLFLNLRFEECISYLQESNIDLRELLQLFPELQPITGLGLNFEPTIVLPRSSGGTLPNNVTDMMSLIRFKRKKIRNKLLLEQNEIEKDDSSSSSSSSSAYLKTNSKLISQQRYDNNATDEEIIDIARQCLLKIFLHRREKMINNDNNQQQQQYMPNLPLIDTCIFHIYALMSSNNPMNTTMNSPVKLLESFVSDTSNCLKTEDVTGVLQRQSLFHVLALLNACKGRKRDALGKI